MFEEEGSEFQGRYNPAFEDDNVSSNVADYGGCEDITFDDEGSERAVDSLDSGEVKSELASEEEVKSSRFHIHQKGIWYSLTSAIIVALTGMAIAYLSGSIGSNQLVTSRMTIQILCCLPMDAFHRVPFKHSVNSYLLVFLRSFLGTVNTCIGYIAYQLMPVSSAKSIQYSTSVFAGFLGWILLKESCSFVDTLFSFLTLAGVVLIAQPAFLFDTTVSVDFSTSSNVLGSILSLLSALLTAVTLIILRKLGSYNMPSLTMITVYSIFGAGFSAILTSVLQQWTLPGCGTDRIILLGNGVGHFISQILIYMALQTERASTVALVHSTDIMFSFIFEYIFFGVVPNYFTITGACVIIGSFIGVTLRKWWKTLKREKEQIDNDGDKCSVVSENSCDNKTVETSFSSENAEAL